MALPIYEHRQVGDHETLRKALTEEGASVSQMYVDDSDTAWVNWDATVPSKNVSLVIRAYGNKSRTPTLEVGLIIGDIELPLSGSLSPEHRAADEEPDQ